MQAEWIAVAIEQKGYQPIKADLDRINNLKTTKDVLNEMTYERTMVSVVDS